MKDFLQRNQTASLIVATTVASLLSAWLLALSNGSFKSLAQLFSAQKLPNVIGAIGIVIAGALITYMAARLARVTANVAQTASGPAITPDQLRLLRIVETPAVVEKGRTAQEALDELDEMIGLMPVKSEVNTLIARLQLERRRREEGMKVSAVSQHMVFTGPPGVGKTVVARAIGDIYRGLGVLKRGHLIQTQRKDIVAGYIGQTAIKMDNICQSALDGILFIDEAYSLVKDDGQDFGGEAIDTLLTFMEDHRDRVIVIVAGYRDRMERFVNSNPGLAGRFSKTIDFPNYAPTELSAILAVMAKSQGFVLPAGYDSRVESWVQDYLTHQKWSNARSMRSLLERAREAHAVRLSRDMSGPLDQLTMDDFDAAFKVMERSLQ